MQFSIKDVDFVSLDQTALMGRIQISRNKSVEKENKRSGGGLLLPAVLLDWPGPELQVDKFIPLWASAQPVMIDAWSRMCQQSSWHYHLPHEMSAGLIWSLNNHHSKHKIISIGKWVGNQNDFHVALTCLTFTGGCSVSDMWRINHICWRKRLEPTRATATVSLQKKEFNLKRSSIFINSRR